MCYLPADALFLKPNEPIMPGKLEKISVKYNMAPGPNEKQ
jgi:hypothetical protein